MEITTKSVRKFFKSKKNLLYMFFWSLMFLAGFAVALLLIARGRV
ncbi:MAG: hypothetical protein V1836_03540 [Candidatus Aenigmatarchaeota archaeon]